MDNTLTNTEKLKREYLSRISDRSIRHKSGAKPDDFLKSFIEIGRYFAYATQDGTWGEFEKELHIIAMELYDARQKITEIRERNKIRPLSEWHEDICKFALWFKFPIDEPPYVGSPLCDDWPEYHTHWMMLPKIGEK